MTRRVNLESHTTIDLTDGESSSSSVAKRLEAQDATAIAREGLQILRRRWPTLFEKDHWRSNTRGNVTNRARPSQDAYTINRNRVLSPQPEPLWDLFIGGVPLELSYNELRDIMQKELGPVRNILYKEGSGFCYIQLSNASNALEAVRKRWIFELGRSMEIKRYKPIGQRGFRSRTQNLEPARSDWRRPSGSSYRNYPRLHKVRRSRDSWSPPYSRACQNTSRERRKRFSRERGDNGYHRKYTYNRDRDLSRDRRSKSPPSRGTVSSYRKRRSSWESAASSKPWYYEPRPLPSRSPDNRNRSLDGAHLDGSKGNWRRRSPSNYSSSSRNDRYDSHWESGRWDGGLDDRACLGTKYEDSQWPSKEKSSPFSNSTSSLHDGAPGRNGKISRETSATEKLRHPTRPRADRCPRDKISSGDNLHISEPSMRDNLRDSCEQKGSAAREKNLQSSSKVEPVVNHHLLHSGASTAHTKRESVSLNKTGQATEDSLVDKRNEHILTSNLSVIKASENIEEKREDCRANGEEAGKISEASSRALHNRYIDWSQDVEFTMEELLETDSAYPDEHITSDGFQNLPLASHGLELPDGCYLSNDLTREKPRLCLANMIVPRRNSSLKAERNLNRIKVHTYKEPKRWERAENETLLVYSMADFYAQFKDKFSQFMAIELESDK
eukprot:CAMPEP_0184491890 /NCGR_PEP_ID=MMETSP0113_2-20130426/21624_1 /TAXON_ID=91329 /ORGANISM="Norrisiella sphaerica, Strain BC52" /LENGTH=668 /DNA_ID=CAMNT_0026876435 /DNA_START=102 /DNA_END=2108 /DNA_ORIENTATION=-